MTIKEFLQKNPTRQEAMEVICKTCNYNQIHVKELEGIDILLNKFNLNINNFYDVGSDYEKYFVGVYNWRYKE